MINQKAIEFDKNKILFNQQKELANTTPFEIAKTLNIDRTEFRECMVSEEVTNILNEDIRAANNIEVTSTPTFIINGQVFIGAITTEESESFI